MNPTLIDSYNVVWNTQSRNSSESMPCGGGSVGLNVWVENGELLIYLARSGTFDELNAMPKIGRLRVTLSPNPFIECQAFRQELHLRKGFVEVIGERDDLRVRVDVWVDVFRPVVHIDVDSTRPTVVVAAYENWRLEDREFTKAEVHSARSWTSAPEKGIVRRDDVEFSGDSVRFVHRNQGRSAFDLVVEQQQLDSVRDKLWNPLENLIWGGIFRGQDMIPDGTAQGIYVSTPFKAWRLRSRAASLRHEMQVAIHVANVPSLQQWHQGMDKIAQDMDLSRNTARRQSETWWEQFWNRSGILINPDHPDPSSPTWQVGRNYQLFRYQLACNAYGDYPSKFNGGLFTFDPEFVDPKRTLNPDFRQWGGGSFTAQNQRLLCWPLLKSGDVDMMRPQFEFYRRALGNAQIRSEVYWGIDGACFTEQIENFGLPVAYEYGWKRKAEVEAGIEDNAWVCYQWDTVFEFCQMILDARLYSGLEIREYLPLIESCLAFYDAFYRREAARRTGKPLSAEGKYVLFPATSLETYKSALNPTPTICALRVVLASLLQLPEEYLPVERRQRWEAMLDAVPPIAFREKDGHKTISPAWEWSHKQNCELPQLYPVYPWGLYGIGKPELDVAINTWKFGADAPDQKQIISWHQDPIFCARLGLTDEAAALTIEKMKDSPRRFPTWWGPGHDWVPDHNWGGSGMIALQEMLMQVDDRTIHLLPTWPKEWDAQFKLHAPYETIVEGAVKNGKLVDLKVTPESRSGDVVMHELR